jgi:hypothetical protein
MFGRGPVAFGASSARAAAESSSATDSARSLLSLPDVTTRGASRTLAQSLPGVLLSVLPCTACFNGMVTRPGSRDSIECGEAVYCVCSAEVAVVALVKPCVLYTCCKCSKHIADLSFPWEYYVLSIKASLAPCTCPSSVWYVRPIQTHASNFTTPKSCTSVMQLPAMDWLCVSCGFFAECPPGTFGSDCRPCPVGSYCEGGWNATAVVCPGNTTSLVGSRTSADCYCLAVSH